MSTNPRIDSILKANLLDGSITGIEEFCLSKLKIPSDPSFTLPTNLRLGHLVETIVSQLINVSTNYRILYENVQVSKDKQTIGEIDFIIENEDSKLVEHVELAYKFYLYDPTISSNPNFNWIGPNRNDSLMAKVKKLSTKQFPLLYHDCARPIFKDLNVDQVVQSLCLLVSLYIPYKFERVLAPAFTNAIKGYYLNADLFVDLDNCKKTYRFPSKQEWGIDPSTNEVWAAFDDVAGHLNQCMKERQAILCWQKCQDLVTSFFIVWW